MASQAEKTARSILREMEDMKLAGQDYPVSSLISLRQVSPSTLFIAACGDSVKGSQVTAGRKERACMQSPIL
jgi:hypothetical protein